MLLQRIIETLPIESVLGDTNRDICSITHDSRKAGTKDIFVAIRGERVDGRKFTPQLNVAAVIADAPVEVRKGVTVIYVPNARQALAQAAATLYEHPSQKMYVIGLTGTNGKSTTAWILEHLMLYHRVPVAVIGTIGHRFQGRDVSTQDGRTTPESSTLQSLFHDWEQKGCQTVIMEVSSIGLAWFRVDGIQFSAAVFTNFSRDHLDFHNTMDDYLASKRRLFSDLLCDRSLSILNADDSAVVQTPVSQGERWNFSATQPSDLFASNIRQTLAGLRCEIQSPKSSFSLSSPLIGRHNVENILCAIGCALGFGLSIQQIQEALSHTPPVPGRLERVPSAIPIFVDYAHTPDALRHALLTLRELCAGKLIVVFGCGGDRDPGKRKIMGEIAEKQSDFPIVTSDNPRSEDPLSIIEEIKQGMSNPLCIVNREEAIQKAIQIASTNDIVLIAGKGHETYQEINGIKHAFDDRIVATRYAPPPSSSNAGSI
ncbi:MAG: UDP-N-acetylmuramoyl-L-alanyl-D-glutamate--2,6-diaminopimelate ligase [Myxococcota bacterium]|nr:UDP-N-acetylmuramoyl-L-alanyl-D-glutamate--2,6-diaminopimelate ligase [Myxococcota bacterium]